MPERAASSTTVFAPSSWSGKILLELVNWLGQRIAILGLVVVGETITVWCGHLEIAIINRQEFRAWLQDPDNAFERHGIVWTVQKNDLCICISLNAGPTYRIPDFTLPNLQAVI
jgi:hypothetical protein